MAPTLEKLKVRFRHSIRLELHPGGPSFQLFGSFVIRKFADVFDSLHILQPASVRHLSRLWSEVCPNHAPEPLFGVFFRYSEDSVSNHIAELDTFRTLGVEGLAVGIPHDDFSSLDS